VTRGMPRWAQSEERRSGCHVPRTTTAADSTDGMDRSERERRARATRVTMVGSGFHDRFVSDRANGDARGLVFAFALVALFGGDHVVLVASRDRLIGALGLAGAAVDARISDLPCHQGLLVNRVVGFWSGRARPAAESY